MPLRPIPRPKGPHVGRPGGRFTQHRRLDRLREALESNPAGLSLDDLAMMLHVTTRSVRRYLRELGLVTEVESVATRPGGAHVWRIKPSERGRAVALRRAQAYGILAARRVFEPLRGSALYDELDLAMRQILLVAQRPSARKGPEAAEGTRLDERFIHVPIGARTYVARAEELDDLFRAVSELRVLRFRPRGPGSAERRAVHPYAMVLLREAIWCLMYDVAGREIVPIAFDRMEAVQVSDREHFELPEDFRVEDYLQGEFGLSRRRPASRVLIEFEPSAAEEIRGRRLHPTQKIATAPDGRVRLSLAVPDLTAVRAWVLHFGASARVIEPPELVADVARELRRAAGRYPALAR